MRSLYLKVTPVSSADGSVSSATAADVSADNSCRACPKATSASNCPRSMPRSVASAAAAAAVRALQPPTTTEVAGAVTSVQFCAGIVVVTLSVTLAMTCDMRLVGGTR